MASRSWNRVELIGNLTRDPELRYTPNGAAVCTFGMATNRTYVTEGERKEEADFHRLVAWNKLAELCNQLLKKGNRVFISGRLQTRSWEGQDGQTRNVTEIVIEDMILLTPKVNGEPVAVPDDLNIEPVKIEKPVDKDSASVATSAKGAATVGEEEPKKEKVSKEKEISKVSEEESQPEEPKTEEIKDDLPF